MPNGGREPNGWPEPERRSGYDRRSPPSAGFFGNMTLTSTWPMIMGAVVLIVWAVNNAGTAERTAADLLSFQNKVTASIEAMSQKQDATNSLLQQKFPAIDADMKSQAERLARLEKEAEQTGDDADKLERRVWTAEQWIAGVAAASPSSPNPNKPDLANPRRR